MSDSTRSVGEAGPPELQAPPARELRALHLCSQRLQRQTDAETLAQEVIAVLEATLDYEYGAVLLIERQTQRLVPFALSQQGHGPEFVERDKDYVRSHELTVGRGITGWVAERGEAVLIGDVRDDPRYYAMRDDIRSELCVPMRVREGVIGVINVESTRPHAYGPPDLHVLEIVAAQISIAVANLRLREDLVSSQRLEALGRLAAAVAHDFNNLLTVILGSAGILEMGRLTPEQVRSEAKTILTAGDGAAALIRQLQSFGRGQALRPAVVNFGRLLGTLEPVLRKLAGDGVTLTFSANGQPDPARVDPGQIEQVIVNLVVNATEAMSGTGRIEIRYANVDHAGDGPETRSGRFVQLTVRDTGPGIDAAVRARMFEPFFSTKREGRGLGLSTVYGIVTQSGGSLSVDSRPGLGTTFDLRFPATSVAAVDPARQPRSTGVDPLLGSLSGTALLVDDQGMVLGIVKEVLERLGLRVVTAADGREALERYRAAPDGIDLLVTDLRMPGMSGVELVEHLRAIDQRLPALVLSGFADPASQLEGLPADVDFLAKPFAVDELAQRVRALLQAPR